MPDKADNVAVITGVGPGLGAALARRFAREGFSLALIARSRLFIDQLAEELPSALPVIADVSRPADIISAIKEVRKELGVIGVLIHSASSAGGNGVIDTTPEQFEQSWRVTALGAFICARETAPDMIEAGTGAMLFTGATSSVRGGGWLGFSSAKFALRGFVQSAARELWPKGIHVAHVVVDGIIASDKTDRAASNETRTHLDPDEIAEAYWYLANQPRSAWTLELDLRPNGEEFFT
ncbi:MAG: SDR family NAD(P)-dependent oxidoreductase [Chthoniobacterales bacterium]